MRSREALRSASGSSAALPPGARVLLHSLKPNLGIGHEAFLDEAGHQGRFVYDGLGGPRALYDTYRSMGVTHVLYSRERGPGATRQEDVLFWDLVTRYCPDQQPFPGMQLITLPAEPPPPDTPYDVLSLGLHGYRDGLYPVQALRTYEHIATISKKERYRAPTTPLPAEVDDQVALAQRANAVLLAKKPKVAAALVDSVKAEFRAAYAFKDFTVYVRR